MGNEKGFDKMIFNLILIVLWDIIVFLRCIYANPKTFDEKRKMYRVKSWEQSGHFYSKVLKIKKWKDFLPQYVSKDGFSKRNLVSTTEEYIEHFILETCRAEWAHKMCLLISVPILFLNNYIEGIILTVAIFAVQLPFIFIQRYNRIRLKKFQNKIQKKARKQELYMEKIENC